MNRRTLLTLSTAASLYGAYELYACFVSPLLAPATANPTTTSAPIDETPRLVKNRQAAEKYLADYPWAANAKYNVRTEDAFVYAEEWKRVEPGGEVRFRPFAMIWRRAGESEDKQPITIVSDSALVKFVSRFEITNPKPGRVIGGALEGNVFIRGENGLSVTGRNFNFAEGALKIWSDNPVAFTSGPHKGSGDKLELDLIPEPNSGSQDKPAVSGVRTVRLLRNVVMDLVPESKDKQDKDTPPATVRVTSAGSFEYAVESHIAAFQNDVRVVRPTGKDPVTGKDQFDTLTCDRLTLVFEPAPAAGDGKSPATGAGAKPKESPLGKLGENVTFRRLRAEGKQVVLVSQGNEMQADMTELTYDAQSRIVTLHDGKQVKVVQKNNEIVCPEITIEHDANNKPVQAICRGTGKLHSYNPEPTPQGGRTLAFSAEWLKQLRQYPDATPGLDVIEFEQQAVLDRPGEMVLQADVIKIWVTQNGGKPPVAVQNNTPGKPSSDLPPVKPKRLLAIKQVSFRSPQVEGQTERLEVWFEEGKLPLVRPAAQGPGAGSQGSAIRNQVPGARGQGPAALGQGSGVARVSPPKIREGATAFASVDDDRVVALAAEKLPPPQLPDKPSAGAPPEKPLHITADLIRVRSIEEGDQREVAEIWNQGRVHVTQERPAGIAPLDIKGDRLHLRNYAGDKHIIRIEGTPAQVHDRDMQLEGPDINLDRGENFAHVIGAGVLRLPVNNSPDGKPLDKPQILDVSWKEQMQFDGELAKFFVDVIAVHGDSRMRCQEMRVTLSQRVSFAAREPQSQNAEVTVVFCKDAVQLENFEYIGNKLTGIQRATVNQATLIQSTGETTAQGPGTLVSWRRGEGKRAGPASKSAIQANKSMQTETREWDYTQVNFAGMMNGNTRERHSIFQDRVRVIHGPVRDSTEVIDIESLPLDGGWMECQKLHVTQHPAARAQTAYVDMVATGNTKLHGRVTQGTFTANADSVSFDQSKGLYILQSFGNHHATIWRQTTVGGPTSPVPGRRMEFTPGLGLNHLLIDKSPGLDLIE